MRSRVTMVLAVVAVLLGSVLLVPAAYARLSGDDTGGSAAARQSVAAPAPTAAAAAHPGRRPGRR